MRRGYLHITGGRPLEGTVEASGSKNAALPIMAASLLADSAVRLRRVPRLADVDSLAAVLRCLGMDVGRDGDAIRIAPRDSAPFQAGYTHVRRMRASFCVLGPLLARRGRAVVALPGGCRIGPRPVDLHLKGLAALGADLSIRNGNVVARAARLRGAKIDLAGPAGSTVTGTANVMSAATLARGTTTILHAAREPEIVDLGRFLNRLGADIEGLGSSTVTIRGVDQLGGAAYRVTADRIEAATLLLAGAITGGRVSVEKIVPGDLSAVFERLDQAGMELAIGDDRVSLLAERLPRPLRITATPYPGFPTDLQAQFTALLCLARGQSRVADAVFPQRFLHLAELRRLGAEVAAGAAGAVVRGPCRLSGAPVAATDLRAGAALVLAGLAAKGKTVVHGVNHLERGYERLDRKLAALGADIVRKDHAAHCIPNGPA